MVRRIDAAQATNAPSVLRIALDRNIPGFGKKKTSQK